MTQPFYIYVTRPDAYELYMGGWRSVGLWVDKPMYSHAPNRTELTFGTKEIGWTAQNQQYQFYARCALKHDTLLSEPVWDSIFLSVLPKGMTFEEGSKWWREETTFDFLGSPRKDTNWAALANDKDWESKCNTCHKRFLLRVDVRSGSVEQLTPSIQLPMRSAGIVHTLDIDANLATRVNVPDSEIDIPW